MQDFDGSAADLLSMNFFNDWKQTSHEFRITSQFSETFEFIAGVYDWESDFKQRWDVYDLFYQLSRLGGPALGRLVDRVLKAILMSFRGNQTWRAIMVRLRLPLLRHSSSQATGT